MGKGGGLVPAGRRTPSNYIQGETSCRKNPGGYSVGFVRGSHAWFLWMHMAINDSETIKNESEMIKVKQ